MKQIKLKIFFVLLMLTATPFLMADLGPKPSADFEIIYEISPAPELVEYALYLCDDASCSDPYKLEPAGPQRFECTQDGCTSLAYGYADFMFITLDFADGTSLTSNIFTKDHFDAEYEIFVGSHDLTVTETGGSNSGQFGGLAGMMLIMIALYACIGIAILAIIILVIILIVRAIRRSREKQVTEE